MTAKTFDPSLALVLAHEGGFVNNPKDPGGPTNKGITQRVYDRHRKANGLPLRSVKLIEDSELATIYRDDYWNMIAGDKMPAGVDYAMFDFAVNSGPHQSVVEIQRTINENPKMFGVTKSLVVDGLLGQSTVDAVQLAGATDAEKLIEMFCARRVAYCKTLKNYSTFGAGWVRRVEGAHDGQQDTDDGVVDIAVVMARQPVVVANVAVPSATPATPAGGVVITPPAAIGARVNETPGKAFASQVALMRTVQGAGAALAAAGVTGNTAMDAAGTVKSHINNTIIGQIALIVFVLLTLGGVGLVLYKFFEDRKEKTPK